MALVKAEKAVLKRNDADPNSALGLLKPLLSALLDAASNASPMLKIPRDIAKGFGFAQRTYKVPSGGKRGKGRRNGPSNTVARQKQQGGVVVSVENAPVAFSRKNIQVGRTLLKQERDGSGETVRVIDLIGKVFLPATPNTFNLAPFALAPLNPAVFPGTFVQHEGWEKYKFLRLVLHFCHFASTAAQAAVNMAFQSDVDEAAPISQTELVQLRNAMTGSCYEDFALEVDPRSLSPEMWFFNDLTPAVGADSRFNFPGLILLGSDANVNTSANVGYVYIEADIAFKDRRLPTTGVGELNQAVMARRQIPNALRPQFDDFVVTKLRSFLEKGDSRCVSDKYVQFPLVNEFNNAQRRTDPTRR